MQYGGCSDGWIFDGWGGNGWGCKWNRKGRHLDMWFYQPSVLVKAREGLQKGRKIGREVGRPFTWLFYASHNVC